MDVKNSVAVVAALLAFGVGGTAIASASDEGNDDNGAPVTTTAPSTAPDQSAADEQESGEQGDVENTDLATAVEEADGADNQDGVNEEGEVGDGADGQVGDEADGEVDDGPAGD